MIDIKYFRENSEEAKATLKRIGADAFVDKVLDLDKQRRFMQSDLDELKNKRNVVSKEIGLSKDNDERNTKISEMKELSSVIKGKEDKLHDIKEGFEQTLLEIPNLPDSAVPDGDDESANVVVSEYGVKPEFSFPVKPHWELGENSGGIDFARGVKISGTRFYILKDGYARLQRALINFMLDFHVNENGFNEVYPPFMVRKACMYGTGQLPKFEDTLYKDIEEDFYFIPTAEVPLTNMYRDEILDESDLPLKNVALTACFRREKMSAGKDSKGIKRGHQFDKVEMVVLVKPENSKKEYEALVGYAAGVIEKLELPYRKLNICAGDLSFTASQKYDLEVWAAGCEEWLEVSSISNFKDFQARRANLKFKNRETGKNEYLHTINGSGLALPRIMIAIIENYQTEDGRIKVPEVLKGYLGGKDFLD